MKKRYLKKLSVQGIRTSQKEWLQKEAERLNCAEADIVRILLDCGIGGVLYRYAAEEWIEANNND